MVVVRSKTVIPEKVDDPLIAEEVGVGVARSPQLGDQVFIGLQFKGMEGIEAAHGHVVLTLEMAENVAELLREACAKARAGEAQYGDQ